ncbi:MAG: hypothetical protein C5B48_14380 [Candidatus Rokuibacteriota bacterium]|nr:MAG: hypothetical protein C5B48_14380 [Candidatus Rokubacteria bacterium]
MSAVRVSLAALVGLLVAVLAGAADNVIVVDDWSKPEVGAHGVPAGWQAQSWGSGKYDFTVVAEGQQKALRLRSDDDSSTISKEIKIDVKQFPIVQWRWKVTALPKSGDARRKETDDEAAQLYVTFPRFPSAVRSRIIGYIWDSNAPAASVFPSAKVGMVTFVVVRSGEADAGKWYTETRNVLEDYKRIYNEDPGESVGAVSLSINSQNTHGRAESYFGEILFRKP